MIGTRFSKLVAAGVCVASALLATGGIAAATPEAGDAALAALKSRCALEIDRRVTTLSHLTAVVDAAKHLSDADRAALDQRVGADVSALNQLKTKIAGDTDLATARADCRSIVTQFRVYVLVEPVAHIDRAADAGLDAVDHLTSVQSKLGAAVALAKSKGADVAAMETALTDMAAKTAAAKSALAPIPQQVLALTPSQWPGAHSTLQGARQSLRTAHADLVAARQDAATVVAGLAALAGK